MARSMRFPSLRRLALPSTLVASLLAFAGCSGDDDDGAGKGQGVGSGNKGGASGASGLAVGGRAGGGAGGAKAGAAGTGGGSAGSGAGPVAGGAGAGGLGGASAGAGGSSGGVAGSNAGGSAGDAGAGSAGATGGSNAGSAGAGGSNAGAAGNAGSAGDAGTAGAAGSTGAAGGGAGGSAGAAGNAGNAGVSGGAGAAGSAGNAGAAGATANPDTACLPRRSCSPDTCGPGLVCVAEMACLPAGAIAYWPAGCGGKNVIAGPIGDATWQTNGAGVPRYAATSDGSPGAFAFDGSGEAWLTVPHTAELAPAAYTIALWYQVDAAADTATSANGWHLLGKDGYMAGDGATRQYLLMTNEESSPGSHSRSNRFHTWGADSAIHFFYTTPERTDGQWVHLAQELDDKTLRGYVDGVVAGEVSAATTIGVAAGTSALHIGGGPTSVAEIYNQFHGRIGDIVLFDSALKSSVKAVADNTR